ncbi:hypothetical protein SAMN05192553_101697 [Cyclobacterium xiamenense]|uniref:Uncharacterized protein n=2 Tax=Cyclobacterium xiamenense TaxID=1297121 RepID=A0A1H6UK42_9BACT|nr:hypothetical protein SAMN05192553_101697 [Cyclobacterium xiamenense]
MEKMDNGKWAIMEKVFHEDEEKLTDLATFILRLSESPVGIKQCNQELEDAKVGMDRGARYLQEDIEGMGYKW